MVLAVWVALVVLVVVVVVVVVLDEPDPSSDHRCNPRHASQTTCLCDPQLAVDCLLPKSLGLKQVRECVGMGPVACVHCSGNSGSSGGGSNNSNRNGGRVDAEAVLNLRPQSEGIRQSEALTSWR